MGSWRRFVFGLVLGAAFCLGAVAAPVANAADDEADAKSGADGKAE
jgi:hypothetical protein